MSHASKFAASPSFQLSLLPPGPDRSLRREEERKAEGIVTKTSNYKKNLSSSSFAFAAFCLESYTIVKFPFLLFNLRFRTRKSKKVLRT